MFLKWITYSPFRYVIILQNMSSDKDMERLSQSDSGLGATAAFWK